VRLDALDGRDGGAGDDAGWELPPERRDAIRAAAAGALERGPLLGAPLLGVGLTVHVPPPAAAAGAAAAAAAAGAPGLGEPAVPLPALRSAVAAAVAAATAAAAPRVVEPLMDVALDVPAACVGDVVAALTDPRRRRGVVLGVDVDDGGGGGGGGGGAAAAAGAVAAGGAAAAAAAAADAALARAHLTARVPVEGLLGWASRLRSLTGGEGGFVARFGGYEVCSAEARVVREERGY